MRRRQRGEMFNQALAGGEARRDFSQASPDAHMRCR